MTVSDSFLLLPNRNAQQQRVCFFYCCFEGGCMYICYIGYFSHCEDKIPEKRNLRKKFAFQSLSSIVSKCGTGVASKVRDGWSYAPAVRKQKGNNVGTRITCSFFPPPFIQYWHLGQCCSHLGWVFSLQLNHYKCSVICLLSDSKCSQTNKVKIDTQLF